MRDYKRIKLGLPPKDIALKEEVESKIQKFSPVSLTQESSEYQNSNRVLKTINIGTIKNPKAEIVGNLKNTNTYFSVQNPNTFYYYGKSAYTYYLNGQIYLYNGHIGGYGSIGGYGNVGGYVVNDNSFKNLDPQNPYDPIFSSYDRLTNFSPYVSKSGALTGYVPKLTIHSGASGLYGVSSGKSGFLVPIYLSKFTVAASGQLGYLAGKTFQLYPDYTGQNQFTARSGDPLYFSFDQPYPVVSPNSITEYILFDSTGRWGVGSGRWIYLHAFVGSGITKFGKSGAMPIMVSNAQDQNRNEIPTYEWIATTQAKNWPTGLGFKPFTGQFISNYTGQGGFPHFQIYNNSNLLTTIVTGWKTEEIKMGGKQQYLLNNKGSFVNGLGFYKLATTRQSYGDSTIYARVTGVTGLIIGNTTGTIPTNFAPVTFPHSYLTKSFGALRYNAIIVPEAYGPATKISGKLYSSGARDIIVISTGINEKKIVYVSPNEITSFTGYWSTPVEQAKTITRVKKVAGSGVTGTYPTYIYELRSGALISVSNKNMLTPVKTSYPVIIVASGSATDYTSGFYYDIANCMLKTTGSLKNNNFYKLYEPVYQSGAFNTGTWNGVIPSGTPFQIEIIRTNSNQYGLNKIGLAVYAQDYFKFFGGSGNNAAYIVNRGYENKYGLFGIFQGWSTFISNTSQIEANYRADLEAYNLAMSKINGALWDKGISVQNSAATRSIRLFNGGVFPLRSYSYKKANEETVQVYGIKTSAGIRTYNGELIEVDEETKLSTAEKNIWKRER